jgi:hypothetical protein
MRHRIRMWRLARLERKEKESHAAFERSLERLRKEDPEAADRLEMEAASRRVEAFRDSGLGEILDRWGAPMPWEKEYRPKHREVNEKYRWVDEDEEEEEEEER